MDDAETSNRPSVDIPSSDEFIKCRNTGYGDLNVFGDGVFGHTNLDPSMSSSITIGADFVMHDNTGARCFNFIEDGAHDDRDLFLPMDNSILTRNDPILSPKISDDDLNPEVFKDLDISLDDLNACLTVSKMVNDSIIKGMVTDIIEEANEKITMKDMQILGMSEKLRQYELAETSSKFSASMEREPKQEGQQTESCSLASCMEQTHMDYLHDLKIATVDQLQMLKKSIEHLICTSLMEVNLLYSSGCPPCCSVTYDQGQSPDNFNKFDKKSDSLKMFVGAVADQVNKIFCLFVDSISEQKWTYDLQKEFMALSVKDSVKRLQDEFGSKLSEERKMHSNNFSRMFVEIKHLRKELHHISRSLFSYELGHLGCQSGHENIEERNTVRTKDNSFSAPSHSAKVMLEPAESPQLLCMTKEDLISYYRAEINKMRRHHESALQEKTEELFAVKRELLKEKGSFSSKKDRDYEVLRKNITEMIAKLDNILLDSEKYIVEYGYEKSTTGKGNSCDLHWDCQSPRDSLWNKKEISEWLLRSETENMPCPSGKSLQTDKPEWDMEDVKIDSVLRDIVHTEFWRYWISETKNNFESMDMEVKTIHEIYSTMLTVSFEESKTMIDNMKTKYDAINSLLESSLHRKENTLHSEVERASKLMHELRSLSKQMEVKEEYIKEVECASILQKKHFEEVCQELSLLKDREMKQAELCRNELESVKIQLEEVICEVHQYEEKNATLDKKLLVALNELDETRKEKTSHQNIIQVKENQISTMNIEEIVQKEKIRSLIFSVLEVSRSCDALVGNMLGKIQIQTARLDSLKYQTDQLMQHVDLLQRKISSYERNLEIKSSNLQKAETEVDLLADEVDALINLLAKIYIALEHYSPVFQHYPGVMEMLKLIKREVKGV